MQTVYRIKREMHKVMKCARRFNPGGPWVAIWNQKFDIYQCGSRFAWLKMSMIGCEGEGKTTLSLVILNFLIVGHVTVEAG